MPITDIHGIDLYYEIHGETHDIGVPLVLVAGLASDSQSWQPVVEDLSSRHFVVTFDNRGVGRTRPQDTQISISQIADDCVGLIRHLGLSYVNLLGHSMGGFIALDLAIRYPEWVNQLILASTSASSSSRNNALFSNWVSCLESGMDSRLWYRNLFFWFFSRQFFDNQVAVDEAVRYALDYPYPQSAIALGNQVKALASFDCTDDLATISAKTMVISGREDLLFPFEVCTHLAQAIPGASLRTIDNAAHSIHWEQPQAFTDSVSEFLSQN